MSHITERNYQLNRPVIDIQASKSGGEKFNNFQNRDYNLKPTINQGGFESIPTMPMKSQDVQLPEFDSEKNKMRQRIYGMQQDRNSSLANIKFGQ